MLRKQISNEERRDSIRAKRIITVRHRLVRHNGRKAESIWQLAVTENMSLSGLLLVSALSYHIGDIIELQVVMSGVIDIFNGFGKVVRVSRNKAGYYKVGIKYVELKIKHRPARSIVGSRA